MRFLTLLALVLLAACSDAGSGCDDAAPLNFPEIY